MESPRPKQEEIHVDRHMYVNFLPRNATNHFRSELLGSPSTYCVFLCFDKRGFQSCSLCQEEVGSLQEEGVLCASLHQSCYPY